MGHCIGEPPALVEAMIENKNAYEDIEIVHMVAMGKGAYVQPGMEKHFRHNAIFVGGVTRKAVNEGRADYTPCFFLRYQDCLRMDICPVDYVNDPAVIMKNYRMVSINSCVQVDLMGQIASETIGYKQFSGVGGQVNFVRGASMSAGGKSIIATLSTAAEGKISRIVQSWTREQR